MMLREGRDVKNVTVVLGLRPFTAAAEIWRSRAARRYQRTNLHNKSRRFRNELPEKCKGHHVRRIPIGEFLGTVWPVAVRPSNYSQQSSAQLVLAHVLA